jgi:hypothetical protein
VNELRRIIAIQWREKMVIAQPHGDGRVMLVAATQMSRLTGHVPFVERVMQVCFDILVQQNSILYGEFLTVLREAWNCFV